MMKYNFKEEKYPNDIRKLISKIHTECEELKNCRPYKISELFEIKTDGKKYKTEILDNLSNNNKEIKGLYAFINNDGEIVYIGISQSIIRRLKQHFFGKLHNQATLVYLMAKHMHINHKNEERKYLRNDFPFNEYRDEIQEGFKEVFRIVIQPTIDNFELYLKRDILCLLLYTVLEYF